MSIEFIPFTEHEEAPQHSITEVMVERLRTIQRALGRSCVELSQANMRHTQLIQDSITIKAELRSAGIDPLAIIEELHNEQSGAPRPGRHLYAVEDLGDAE